MVQGLARPRSSTSGSTTSAPRRKSRASTASVQSTSTQPLHQYQQQSETASHTFSGYEAQPQTIQYTPEEMITRSQQQLTNPNQAYAIDPSLQNHPSHGSAVSMNHNFNSSSTSIRPPMSQYHSFNGQENQVMEGLNDDQGQEDAGTGDGKKKKGSASSIANDLELRRLFRENQGRALKDVAAQVLANERGPKSEKTKQIFAMLWLYAVCKKSSSSVPRNRVFSHYATRCGTERVPPLNPASFGKLVRIIFPGIQTRRLGMRGESKYHYVDLSLTEDQSEFQEPQGPKAFGLGMDKQSIRRHRSQPPADTALFPSTDIPLASQFSNSDTCQNVAPECLYLDFAATKIHRGPSLTNMVRRELKFPTCGEPSHHEDDSIDLPSIHNYIPIGTDPDAADALTALYRSHCVSVIDCFRFCKEKMFWHHFTSFHGTLTVPVQKLLAHPNIAPWVKECDWLMYQKMIRFVAPLALQVVPIRVIDTFRAISNKLGSHISVTFQNHPQHVQDAKLGPAIIFAGLLDRLLRVNATAHAAANMLTNDANRDQMWHDWVHYVKPTRVVESSLPGCGYTRVLNILTDEIRDLLGPLKNTSYIGMDPLFEKQDNHPASELSQHPHRELAEGSTQGVLDRWNNFLSTLPLRFPGADARQLLHCVGEAGAAALRDITMAQALSFGSWWVTKVWVDEMLLWLAEKGGFMEHSPGSMVMRGQIDLSLDPTFATEETSEIFGNSRPRSAASESFDAPSRFGSIGAAHTFPSDHARAASVPHLPNEHIELPRSGVFHQQHQHVELRHATVPTPQSHPGLPQRKVSRLSSTRPGAEDRVGILKESEMDNDDSGIGMELEHEELRLATYDGFIAIGVNGASDPADVVVC